MASGQSNIGTTRARVPTKHSCSGQEAKSASVAVLSDLLVQGSDPGVKPIGRGSAVSMPELLPGAFARGFEPGAIRRRGVGRHGAGEQGDDKE